MKAINNLSQSILSDIYQDQRVIETVVLIDHTDFAERLSKCLENLNIQLRGTISNLGAIDQSIRFMNPDALIISLEPAFDQSKFELVKAIKLEHDLPFLVIQSHKNHELDKWASELNPDGVIYKDRSDEEIEETLMRSFR